MISLVGQIYELSRGSTVYPDASPEAEPGMVETTMWGVVTDDVIDGRKHKIRVEVRLTTLNRDVSVEEAWYMYR